MTRKLIHNLNEVSTYKFCIFVIIAMSLFYIFFYKVIFDFLPNSIIYDKAEQVLKTTSDAKHYKNEIIASCNNFSLVCNGCNLSKLLSLVWENIKSVLCKFGITTIFRLGFLNLILILSFQVTLTTLVFKAFNIKLKYQKIGLLILLMLPTQYCWLLQPIKDGWLVIANLISLYLIVKFDEKANTRRDILVILGLILVFILLVGIARQQYIYLILMPILIAASLSVFSYKLPKKLTSLISRVMLKGAIAMGLVLPLLYLEKNKENYYEENFSNRSYVVRPDLGTENDEINQVDIKTPGENKFENTNIVNKIKVNKVFNLPFLNKFKTLIEIRNAYADRYTENFTYIDPVKFNSVSAGISYLPKSIIIGVTTPLNILNLKDADVRSSTPILQIIAQVEILVFMALICFALLMVVRYKRELWLNFAMVVIFYIPPATIVAFAMPNAGVIVRQRFPFLYISVVLLLITCFKIFEFIESGKQKRC